MQELLGAVQILFESILRIIEADNALEIGEKIQA